MAWHTFAYRQSIGPTTTLTELNVVPDDILTRSGDKRFLVPADYRFIRFVQASGPNLTRAVLRSPSLEVRRQQYEVVPRRRGGETLNLTALEISHPVRPVMLVSTEELSALATTDGASASVVNVVVSLGLENPPMAPAGDMRIIRFLGSTTLVPGQWTTVTVTPELALEAGTYVITGFLAISAGCIAARVLLRGQAYRPGLPGLAGTEATAVDYDHAMMAKLFGYNLGSFTHIELPQFQFLSASADTTQTVIVYAVKVS